MATKETESTPSPQPAPNRGPLLVLITGAIAVAALLGWALTRSVEPAAPEAAAVTATGTAPAPAETAAPVPGPPPPSATSSPGPDPNTGVSRVVAQELKTLLDRGAVTIVDVRDSVSYANGHIPGAIHIPFTRVEGESRYLPKDKPIVAYCT